MRSDNFHLAIANGNTRFEICLMVAKGVRLAHIHGNRLEDSITQVLGMLPTHRRPNIDQPLVPAKFVAA